MSTAMKPVDPLAEMGDEPDVPLLCDELSRCNWEMGTHIERIEDTRYCRWPGQSSDGKKWARNLRGQGEKAFPWDGASDTRPFMADELVNSMVDLTSTSFWRGLLKVAPVDLQDLDVSGTATTLIHWAVYNRLFNSLVNEVELLGQYVFTYGWAALHICWTQEMGLRKQTLSIEQIQQMAQEAPEGSIIRDLPQLIENPEAHDQVIELLTGVFPHLTRKRARKAVKQLASTGACDFPLPIIQKNEPTVTALVPYDDFCFPPETTDLQTARVVFWRRRLNEVDFRAEARVNGWDQDWVEAVIQTPNQESGFPRVVAAGLQDTVWDRQNMLEVVWAYTKTLDDDDIPAIYCTVFSPQVQDKFGSHELLDYGHGEYPFVVFRAEKIHRKIVETRGIPEITRTWQQELKVQRDSIYDYTSINTLPPLQVPKGRAGSITLAPAAQLPVLRPGEISFLQPPAREPGIAFQLIEQIEVQADRYFGRPTEKVFPVLTQMRQQRLVSTWLHGWTLAFRQVLALTIQYLSPEEMMRITGSQIPIDQSAPSFDITLTFDVRELSSDLATEKLKAISQFVLPLDSAGVVDRAKLVKLALRAVDPSMADELVMESGPARQKLFDETNEDMSLMFVGNPPRLRENDPAAQARLGFAQQILQSNPKYKTALATDPVFQQSMEDYQKNLQFSVQQQQNAMTGRLGVAGQNPMQVQPSAPAAAA